MVHAAERNRDLRNDPADSDAPSRLKRTRFAVRLAIAAERLWPLVLPLLGVAALFLSVSWFGLFRLMPDWLRIAVAVLFGVAAVAALVPLRFYRRPAAAEIDRRIERANGLEHAPVAAQGDRLAGSDDDFAQALWREHQKRMAGRLGALAGDLPRPRIPERDPWGARAAVTLLLVTAFAFSGSHRGGGVFDAFVPAAGPEVAPARIDAWVTPPSYTGRAPVFLTADGNREQPVFTVPAGSDFSVRVTGGSGVETLTFIDKAGETALEPAVTPDARDGAAAARQFGGKLPHDGLLTLKAGATELRRWTFRVIPDLPPTIALAGEPKRAVNGTLDLAYTVEDDYGAVSGNAEFKQETADAPGAHPLYGAPEMPLTLPRRGAQDKAARTTRDLTQHPWAGSRVALTLSVKDAAGQEGRSPTREMVLPERPFSNPLARAVIEQRRLLALDANSKARVLRLMDALTLRPEEGFDNLGHYLAIMSARARLKIAGTDDQYRDVVDYLWQIALGIEEGDLSAAEKRLKQAQEALRDALKNGASEEEISKLMQELRQAMNDFLREFAERQAQNPNAAQQQMPPNGQELRQSDLERMLDQIENLAKSGARDKAEQMLSQLQDMMNNLQMGQRQQGQQGRQQGQMRQQMDKLGEMMRRQQELMNETFQADRGQTDRGQRGQQPGQPRPGQGEQGGRDGQPMSPQEFAEALRQLQQGQGQLQQQLQQFMRSLRGMGIEPGEGFGEAGNAMGEAGQALGEADGERAVGEQGRALEAMRRGAQDMMDKMQQAMQGQQGGSQQGGRDQNADRDPLGRPRATTGPDFGNSVKVPDEIDVQRARRILEEIRKRLGNALSPELERDYLERLLQLR